MTTKFQTFFISFVVGEELRSIRVRAKSEYEAKLRASDLLPPEAELKGIRQIYFRKRPKRKGPTRVYPL